jgi:hypothetical protein
VCQIVSNANLGTAAWHWHDTDQVHCHATTAIGYEPVASTRSELRHGKGRSCQLTLNVI